MIFESLLNSVESSSAWRADKAEQYPGDDRNRQSSDSLATLAKSLRDLPATGELVSTYEAVVERLMDLGDDYRVSEHESHHIGRYGFDYPQEGDAATFLSALIGTYQEWIVEAEEKATKAARERQYEAALESATEASHAAARQKAALAAKEAAKKAALAAHKKAFQKAFEEAYEETYREALLVSQNIQPRKTRKV